MSAVSTVTAATPQRLRSQARQLARHLRAKQRELDRREALLHAQVAKHEEEQRMSRLWLRERSEEMRRRESDLVDHCGEVEMKAASLAAAEFAVDDDLQRRERSLAEREQQLSQSRSAFQRDVRRWEAQVAAAAEADRRAREESDKLRAELDADRQRLTAERAEFDLTQHRLIRNHDRRRESLERMYAELQQRLAEHDPADLRRELSEAIELVRGRARQLDQQDAALRELMAETEAERLHHATEVKQQRARFAAACRQTERQQAEVCRELDERREALRREAESLDKQREIVERMRAEMTAMHRAALEDRLAAEQLTAELQTGKSAAETTRALAEQRARLTDAFDLDRREMEGRRSELKQLAAELADQQEQLNEQREQLRQWLNRQRENLERDASRLIAGEHALDRDRRSIEQRDQQWTMERRALHQRLCDLMGQVRTELVE